MSDSSIISVVFRDDRIEWTVSDLHKGRPEIIQQKGVPLVWPEGMEDHRTPEAAAFVKSSLPVFKGKAGIFIPSDRVLMRVVELPSNDHDELMGMAELQVDKFSPFPVEQMAVAVEVLESKPESSRVLVAAVQRDYIDQLGEFLMKAGVYPQVVDVDVLGWWTLLRDEQRLLGQGQEVIIVYDDHCAQVMVARDGVPVVIRGLDTTLSLADPALSREIVEEIEYTLMTIEAGWGAVPSSRLTIATRGAVPAALLEGLAADVQMDVKTVDLGSLPPLSEGLNRRMTSRASLALNLAPPAWIRTVLSRQLQRKALVITAAAAAVWVVLLGGLWFWSARQKTMLARTQAEIARLQAEVEEVRELKSEYESLQQYADRTYSTLECLREIASLLPPGVDITSFAYNKTAQLNLRGESDTDGPINEFIARLEKSPLFASVTTEGISTASRGGRPRSQFRLVMTLPVTGGEES